MSWAPNVLMFGSNPSLLASAARKVAYERKILGVEVDNSLVMVYHEPTAGDDYMVLTLDPAFMDKFDMVVNLDKTEI